MATSGNIDRVLSSWLTMRLRWIVNSQDIANNTSNMTVTVQLITTGGHIDSTASKAIELTINGTKYTSTCTVGIAANTTRNIYSKTVTVNHNSDGTKDIAISCLLTFDATISSAWWGDRLLNGTASLNTIPRKSTLTASNGTLGVAQTLTISRKSSSFTHTITYTCGSASGTIVTKSTATSFSFTPPKSLASQNTTGTTVSIKFTITTYSGSTKIGSNTKTISCSIPADIKPSCSITVSDAAGYSVYVKGYSKFKITVNPTTSYGSAIASYSITANGVTYSTATVTTGVISSSGSLKITASVTDKRGRKATVTKTVTVYDKSTLTASNGTLGVAQTLTINRQSTVFTHTLTYSCGSESGSLVTNTSSTSIAANFGLDFAKQNTTGTSVSVTFILTTFCNSTNIGSTTKTVIYSIPESVKPSVIIETSDTSGAFTKYSAFVKSLSNLKVDLRVTKAQNSDIASYETKIEDKKFTSASFEAGKITSTANITISTTVTDKRGRTGTATKTITGILDYYPPYIAFLNVNRCNDDGTKNDTGDYVMVTYTATVSPLNNLNSARYELKYKKTSDDDFVTGNGETVSGLYSLSNRQFVFEADTGSSYDILLTVTDAHFTTPRSGDVSTAFVMEHWAADGRSLGLGKIAEIPNGLDIGFKTRFYGGIVPMILHDNTDFNNLTTPNIYVTETATQASTLINCPVSTGSFDLEVMETGTSGILKQKITFYSKNNPRKYERFYYGNAWGEWVKVSSFGNSLLWSGSQQMNKTNSGINLSQKVSEQLTGIVLVFSVAGNDYYRHSVFIPKYEVNDAVGCDRARPFFLCGTKFDFVATKTLYIKDGEINGLDDNDDKGTNNGITYDNSKFVLRYVIGV